MSESAAAVVIKTVLFILVIVDIVGNSVVCAIVKRNRDMRTPINYLLVNLAIADILFAMFITPKVFYQLSFARHPDGVIGTLLCKFVSAGVIAWTASACSLVTMVAITTERYRAVMYPHGNKWNFTNHTIKVIIPITWIFALIFNVPLYLVKNVAKTKGGKPCVSVWPKSWMAKTHNVTWLVGIVLSLLLMIGLYSRIVYSLWFKRNENGQLTQQQQGVVKVRKRVTLMAVTITAIFGICWGTNSIVYDLEFIAPFNIGPLLMVISDTMVLFNSAVNPFVYALLNQQFRKKMKKMICCTASSASRGHTLTTLPTRPKQQEQVTPSDVISGFQGLESVNTF